MGAPWTGLCRPASGPPTSYTPAAGSRVTVTPASSPIHCEPLPVLPTYLLPSVQATHPSSQGTLKMRARTTLCASVVRKLVATCQPTGVTCSGRRIPLPPYSTTSSSRGVLPLVRSQSRNMLLCHSTRGSAAPFPFRTYIGRPLWQVTAWGADQSRCFVKGL